MVTKRPAVRWKGIAWAVWYQGIPMQSRLAAATGRTSLQETSFGRYAIAGRPVTLHDAEPDAVVPEVYGLSPALS